MKENPLAMHFRNPAIYIKLPSGGNFWDEESIDVPINKELPVLPMTARDEISIRTPDALMNGSGVVEVIKSCLPNILNPWKTPSVDLDTILIAMRIATYGSMMDIDSKCPSCGEENSHQADLGVIISSIKTPDYNSPLEIDGLKFYLRPRNYQEVTQTDIVSFEERQLLRAIESEKDLPDEERIRRFSSRLDRLVDLNYTIYTQSVDRIVTPEGVEVRDVAFIREFFENTSNKNIQTFKNKLTEMNEVVSIKPVHVACESCKSQYDVPLQFDYSNFFV